MAGSAAAARPSPSAARARGDFPSGGGGEHQGIDPRQSTARSICRRPTTRGPWTRASGRELWHYFWKTKGGTHIGSRGMAMWHDYVYFETPDNYLVSLEAKTGKERWHKVIADFNQQYFSTMAPVVIGNHVLVGHGQRPRRAGLPAVVRSRDRRAAVEVLYRAA